MASREVGLGLCLVGKDCLDCNLLRPPGRLWGNCRWWLLLVAAKGGQSCIFSHKHGRQVTYGNKWSPYRNLKVR